MGKWNVSSVLGSKVCEDSKKHGDSPELDGNLKGDIFSIVTFKVIPSAEALILVEWMRE